MATTYIREKMNFERYTIIWIDIPSEKFRRIIKNLKVFADIYQCERYIQSLSIYDRIILIINDDFNRDLLKSIHDFEQVYFIYIYCKNKRRNQLSIKQYPKIKGIVSELNELIDRIQSDQTRDHESIPIHIFNTNVNEESSTTGLNGQFLHFQLLIDVLLRLKANPSDKNELISFCKTEYKNNPFELEIIHEFEENYSSDQAIWWYTRESFLYKILNKSLRTQNIDLLFLFRFFIHDIKQQLEFNQYPSSIRVYRSQLISNNEFDLLKNSIGQFISMNSFLSTSLDRQKALSFLYYSENFQSILFEIDADPSIDNIKPFSNITKQSYFPDEEEILFMLGSIFRIMNIHFDSNNFWIIHLNLCNDNQNELKSIFNYMKNQYGSGQTNLLSFGKVLWTMGKYDDAEKYFLRLLNELADNDPLIGYCYHALGNVADDKGDDQTSLKWHFKAIDQFTSNQPILAECYNSIGCVYDTQRDYKQALDYYRKALNIYKNIYGDEHLNVGVCLNNIACIYSEREEYSKALDYYQQVLAIREKLLPKNHADIGAIYNNIGEIYRRLRQYDLALKYLNTANDIYHLSLPSQHPDRAEVLMNIGLVYQNQTNNQQAFDYYQKALKIYQQTLKPSHGSIKKLNQLIQQVQT